MTDIYRVFRRASGKWYLENCETRRQESLRTRDRVEAKRLLQARNEAHRQPAINVQIARAYLSASDPKLVTRNWQDVMETLISTKKGENLHRWSTAIQDRNFDRLRAVPLVETRSDHFLKALADGKVSTNIYLRRIHNFALAMDWLLKTVIPKASWPKVTHKTKRAITQEEHLRIIAREKNPERRVFYELCWYLGGSQMDIACLNGEDVDWHDRTICYDRNKLKGRRERSIKPPLIHFGDQVAALLQPLPKIGPLFPNLRTVESKDRANEFRQRCAGLGIKGITLHCYRNAWAERARKCGYPQRYAQEALGHNSKAVHNAYAKKAEVRVPCLEDWERQMKEKIVRMEFGQPDKAVEPMSIVMSGQ